MEEEKLLALLRERDTNEAFDILNFKSNVGRLYTLQVPYQVTYEVISGNGENDYLNVITLSEKGASYYQEPAQLHNYSFLHMAPHFHDYYEMMIILEGSLSQYIEGNIYHYDAGSVCFLNRTLLHKEQFHQQARLLFLGFSVEYLGQLFRAAEHSHYSAELQILQSPIYDMYHRDTQHSDEKAYLDFIPTIKRSDPYGKIHDMAQTLIDTLMNPTFGTSAMVDGLLCQILSFICDAKNYHCSKVELSKSGDFLLFMHIVHLLEESGGRLSRTELANRLHYSGDYLNRIIKKYTGLSLHEYNMKFTMQQAARLLTETDLSVSRIMQELSFTNRTYFYRLFENQFGMTPSAYRKMARPRQ